jgi:hypothetical protein
VIADKSTARRRLEKKETVMKKRSTYRLLVQSEEKSRNLLEMALYALVAVSVMAAIWQFAEEPAMPMYRANAGTSQQADTAS